MTSELDKAPTSITEQVRMYGEYAERAERWPEIPRLGWMFQLVPAALIVT